MIHNGQCARIGREYLRPEVAAVPLTPLARISLGLGGIILLVGAIAALAHDDWFAGVFLASLGILCLLASFKGIPSRESASPLGALSSKVAEHRGLHTPPTVPWHSSDRAHNDASPSARD